MIAADEFNGAIRDVLVRVFRANEFVVLDLQPVFFPAAGFADNVKKRQMTIRPIGKLNFIHVLSSFDSPVIRSAPYKKLSLYSTAVAARPCHSLECPVPSLELAEDISDRKRFAVATRWVCDALKPVAAGANT
jgi:hypothetical protein